MRVLSRLLEKKINLRKDLSFLPTAGWSALPTIFWAEPKKSHLHFMEKVWKREMC